MLERLHDDLRNGVRVQESREEEPSAAIIDSQSTKGTDTTGKSGYDAGKKIKGSKRHIVVDTLGLLLAVVVHSAAIQDRDGADLVFDKLSGKNITRLESIWADGGYAGNLVEITALERNFEIEIVKRTIDIKGFKVLP